MQAITIPEVGKIYRSATDPKITILVEAVHIIEADEDNDAGFAVEGCDPADKSNMGGIGYEFTTEEWTEHNFSPMSEQR